MRIPGALSAAILAACAAVLAPEAHAAVEGRVLKPDGSPLAGATVQAFERETTERMGERRVAGREPAALATATSAADGTFRLDPKVPFSLVQATADGHAPAILLADDSAPMQVTLARAARRRGVVTGSGKPVANAVVMWVSSEGAEIVTRTAADGSFEAPDPRTLPGQVFVLHPDFAPDGGYVGPQATESLDRELEPGIALRGTAVDAGGRPVADARVWLDGSWPVARTDAKGAFTVPHASREWTSLTVRTPTAVGVLPRTEASGALVVRTLPSRTLTGVVVDSATRRPLAGATVTVSTHAGPASADTDARGQYTLAGLPRGSYRPYAGRKGYESGPKGYDRARPIDLRTAASGRFDTALSPLPQARGRVEDEERRPVEGALVSRGFKNSPNAYGAPGLLSMGMGGGEMVRTAADGTFTLTLSELEWEGFHDSPMAFAAEDRPLVVMKQGFAAAQVPLPKDTNAPVVVTLPRGVELAGQVTDAAGAPVAGVAVTAAEDGSLAGSLFPSEKLLVGGWQPAEGKDEGWTTTDSQGRFALRVHPVAHHLHFRKTGFAPRLVRAHDPRGSEALPVTLDPAAVVRGRVSRADGRGVAEAQVWVLTPDGIGGGANGVTGADGTFEVLDLAPGAYRLTVQHAELGLQETRMIEAPAADVQIVLGPTVVVRGQVLDAATRKPVPSFDVMVTVQGDDDSASREHEARDGSGAFAVEEVPLGLASVRVTADGYSQGEVEDLVLEQDVEPAALEILLQPDAPVRGRVTDGSGQPIADANVNVTKPSAAGSHASTNDDGEYELRGVAAGLLSLDFAADGYVREKRTLDTRQANRLDVTLKRGLSLKGVVVKNGVPVPEAFVAAQSSGRASYVTAQADERGRFSLDGLVPGRYTVTANTPDQGRAKLEDVDPENAGPLRLALEKAATGVLHGRVTGLPEAEMGMVMVMAMNEETGETAQATLDPSRGFRMAEAPTGRIKVRAMAASLAEGATRTSRVVELSLAPGGEADAVLEFSTDITIAGTVVRDGAPVPFVMVSFTPSAGEQASMARTDMRGAYQATGLEPGPHHVSVWGDRVSYQTEYSVTESAELDIDVTGGAVSGRIVRADGGAPVPGVVVAFYRMDGRQNSPDQTATSGGQGAFSQRSLREGRFRLVTSREGFGQEVREVDVTRGATAELTIELTPSDGLGLTVVDARDSRPLEAIVVVRDQARRIVANSHAGADENGAVTIALADGSYLLSTSSSGYGTVTLPVTAPRQGLRVALTPGGTLVIESSRELKGRVRLIQPDGEEYVRCWCNGIGEIQLKGRRTTVENVTPGSYTMEIVDSPEGTKPRAVVVREGETSTVTID